MISITSWTVLVTNETMNYLFGATVGTEYVYLLNHLDASFCHILATFMIVTLTEMVETERDKMALQYHI